MTFFNVSRRKLFERSGALGAVSLLSGCDFDDTKHPLAPTFTASQITRPPRFNAFYDISQAPRVDVATWRLELSGHIGDRRAWRIDQLRALPQESQITRFVCVEGWRVICQWGGVPLRHFLRAISADTRARYVAFRYTDGYLRITTKLGCKNPKSIIAMEITNKWTGGYWANQGYNWFSGS